jgi:branched-chain amino acid aminotransferase
VQLLPHFLLPEVLRMNATAVSNTTLRPAFGTVLAETMVIAEYQEGRWSRAKVRPLGPIPMHPAAHALHYGSSCFEGFKAYRWADGSIHVFRMDRHIERLRQSAGSLVLPEPNADSIAEMVMTAIDCNRAVVPESPGALYLRPLLYGTTPNIGAAAAPATEATLIVLASPVWDYFATGAKPLRLFVDDVHRRTASQMGRVKTGGNYAAALATTLEAQRNYSTDQVLFAPDEEVQETGAANFLLLREGQLLTPGLDSSFLPGVTRDSLLTIARSRGFDVNERMLTVIEMLAWIKSGEAALSGTAAVLAGVGTLVYHGEEHRVGTGEVGPVTRDLRASLVAIQEGRAPDPYGWCQTVPVQ